MNKIRPGLGFTSLLFLSISLLPAARSAAQAPSSVSAPEKDNTPAAQLKSFTLDKRLKVNLFADETMGIANPICFRWDARGRLWVLCTWAYPQLKPGEIPDDKLMILEDVNGDGVIDQAITDRALELLEIDVLGLDPADRNLLRSIIENYGDSPVGLTTIAALTGDEATTIEDFYEPYLLHLGFIERTPRGRRVTPKARSHLEKHG